MNNLSKRDRMNAAFKWREDKKMQHNEELLAHALELFILIIILCQINYIYNNYNKDNQLIYKSLS
jgi:hypothetical protein